MLGCGHVRARGRRSGTRRPVATQLIIIDPCPPELTFHRGVTAKCPGPVKGSRVRALHWSTSMSNPFASISSNELSNVVGGKTQSKDTKKKIRPIFTNFEFVSTKKKEHQGRAVIRP